MDAAFEDHARIEDRQLQDFSDPGRHDFIQIEWRIFVSPRVVIPVYDHQFRVALSCQKNRPVIAAPWFVGWHSIKRDSFHGQSTQNRPRLCFMRPVGNIDTNLFRFDERFDHRAQRRHHAIE